jgi:cytochrome c5
MQRPWAMIAAAVVLLVPLRAMSEAPRAAPAEASTQTRALAAALVEPDGSRARIGGVPYPSGVAAARPLTLCIR